MLYKTVTWLLMRIVHRVLDDEVIEKAHEFVRSLFDQDMKGEDKKKQVKESLIDLADEFKQTIVELPGWILSVAIDAIHAHEFERRKTGQANVDK